MYNGLTSCDGQGNTQHKQCDDDGKTFHFDEEDAVNNEELEYRRAFIDEVGSANEGTPAPPPH